jgi:hypothetical protein
MAELEDLLKRRDVVRYLASRYTVVWAPLWLTGGTSANGRIVYLSTALRDRPTLAARVIYHERVEWALRYLAGLGYDRAHDFATQAERAKYGREPDELRVIVTRNMRKLRRVPRGFDPKLAKAAEESIGS